MKARVICVQDKPVSEGVKILKEKSAGFDFDLALVSFSPEYDVEELTKEFNCMFGKKDYLAFSSILTVGNGEICSEGITVLLVKFERGAKAEFLVIEDLKDKEPVSKVLDFLSERGDNLNFLIAGFGNGYTSNFIETLSDAASKRGLNISLIGGIQGDNINLERYRTYQIFNGRFIEDGFTIISFYNVNYELSVSFGFKPIGPEYKVVDVVGNAVKRIDEESAYYLFERIVSQLPVNDLSPLTYTPIILTSESDGVVNVARTPKKFIFTPGHKSVEFFGPIREGSTFKFSFGNDYFLLKELEENIKTLNFKFPSAELMLSIECLGRTKILQSAVEREKEIYKKLVRVPLFGFHSLGEIAPNRYFNNIKFYNEVHILVALREV